MIRAYRLYNGPDGNSHAERGSVHRDNLPDTEPIHFKETPAQSSYDWHNAPVPEYVITLAGALEFMTVGGETFMIHPGDILLAEDHTGSRHKWRLVNDEPWKRHTSSWRRGQISSFRQTRHELQSRRKDISRNHSNRVRTMAKVTSYQSDIRPLFTERDIQAMSKAFNLASYNDVKTHAAIIYDRIRGIGGAVMPPPPPRGEGPWPQDRIELFARWMADGYQP